MRTVGGGEIAEAGEQDAERHRREEQAQAVRRIPADERRRSPGRREQLGREVGQRGSLDEPHDYDAFGVDPVQRHVYCLTIDRDAWNARFATPLSVSCELHETGALGGGASRLDSVLYLPRECAYRWRPLRRERY